MATDSPAGVGGVWQTAPRVPSPEPSPPAVRYDGLDALRALAMLLGIAFHATWAYVPEIARWYVVEDVATHPGFKALAGVLHAFRMQTFFVLAGFFAHLVLERRGVGGFVRERLHRLGLPLAVFTPLVLAFDVASRRWSAALGRLSPELVWGTEWQWRPLHLWFLEALLLFVLAAGALAAVGLRGHVLARGLTTALRVPAVLLALAAPTALALVHLGEPKPADSFVPQAATLAHYGPFFLLGWLLWLARDAAPALASRRWLFTPVGLGLAVWVYTRDVQYEPRGLWLGALATWLLVLGLLGFAFALPPAKRPRLAFAVEASYWVYLVHYPLVVTGQLLLATLPWPAAVKYAVVVTASAAVAFASFALVARAPAVGAWLGVTRRAAATNAATGRS